MRLAVPAVAADIIQQTHTLIAGTTGAGKSVLLAHIITTIYSRRPDQAAVVLIDPKRIDLRPYKTAPHCIGYADTAPSALRVLRSVSAYMGRVYSDMADGGSTPASDLYIIIDELADLMLSSDGAAIADALQHIGQLGRAAKIHLIAATQQPQRAILPARIVTNFTARLALRCRSAIESRQIIDQSGAEKLPRHGRGIYITPDLLQPVTVDIPPSDGETVAALIAAWNTAQSPK